MRISNNQLVPSILGVAAAFITFVTLTGQILPLIGGPRPALIALFIIGFAMCTTGGLKEVGANLSWASPLAIVGYILGAAVLLIFVGTLAGWKLPLIEDEFQAVEAVAIFIAVKFVIGTVGSFFHLL